MLQGVWCPVCGELVSVRLTVAGGVLEAVELAVWHPCTTSGIDWRSEYLRGVQEDAEAEEEGQEETPDEVAPLDRWEHSGEPREACQYIDGEGRRRWKE